MNMSLSEKIVSGLAIAVLITGFASCAFPKMALVGTFSSSSAKRCSPPSNPSNPSVFARGSSVERQCGHG
jgi:hypothetical protein